MNEIPANMSVQKSIQNVKYLKVLSEQKAPALSKPMVKTLVSNSDWVHRD